MGGDGTLIRFYDPGHLLLPGMKDFLFDNSFRLESSTNTTVVKGGTDSSAAHLENGGVPSTTISVCARYIILTKPFTMDDF